MQLQKYNNKTVIMRNGTNIDPTKLLILQAQDYIDSQNYPSNTPVFEAVALNGGVAVVFGVVITKNSWASFLVFSYAEQSSYMTSRDGEGVWTYKTI